MTPASIAQRGSVQATTADRRNTGSGRAFDDTDQAGFGDVLTDIGDVSTAITSKGAGVKAAAKVAQHPQKAEPAGSGQGTKASLFASLLKPSAEDASSSKDRSAANGEASDNQPVSSRDPGTASNMAAVIAAMVSAAVSSEPQAGKTIATAAPDATKTLTTSSAKTELGDSVSVVASALSKKIIDPASGIAVPKLLQPSDSSQVGSDKLGNVAPTGTAGVAPPVTITDVAVQSHVAVTGDSRIANVTSPILSKLSNDGGQAATFITKTAPSGGVAAVATAPEIAIDTSATFDSQTLDTIPLAPRTSTFDGAGTDPVNPLGVNAENLAEGAGIVPAAVSVATTSASAQTIASIKGGSSSPADAAISRDVKSAPIDPSEPPNKQSNTSTKGEPAGLATGAIANPTSPSIPSAAMPSLSEQTAANSEALDKVLAGEEPDRGTQSPVVAATPQGGAETNPDQAATAARSPAKAPSRAQIAGNAVTPDTLPSDHPDESDSAPQADLTVSPTRVSTEPASDKIIDPSGEKIEAQGTLPDGDASGEPRTEKFEPAVSMTISTVPTTTIDPGIPLVVVPASSTPVQAVAKSIAALTNRQPGAEASPDAIATSTIAAPRTLTLQLTPANMGTISVTMHAVGHALDLKLAVSEKDTLGALSRDREALSKAVLEQGYDLRSLVIQSRDPAPATASHRESQPDQANSQSQSSADRQPSRSGGNQGDGRPKQDVRTSSDETARPATRPRAGALFV